MRNYKKNNTIQNKTVITRLMRTCTELRTAPKNRDYTVVKFNFFYLIVFFFFFLSFKIEKSDEILFFIKIMQGTIFN